MNYTTHADRSAELFGGDSESFFDIHRLIDLNKFVSQNPESRFLLHHYDIGKGILEKIFGKYVNSTESPLSDRVLTEDLLLQHLFEDYHKVPMLIDWLDTFNKEQIFVPVSDRAMKGRIKRHPYLKKVSKKVIDQVEGLLNLSMFTQDESITTHPARFCVFGHATGIQLAEKILGIKIGKDFETSEVFIQYLHTKFGFVPTILDYEAIATKNKWKQPPSGDRLTVQEVKQKMEEYKQAPVSAYDFTGVMRGDEEGRKKAIEEMVKHATKNPPPVTSSRPHRSLHLGRNRNCCKPKKYS